MGNSQGLGGGSGKNFKQLKGDQDYVQKDDLIGCQYTPDRYSGL
jgi:hypothetical protein